jgi:DNA polymerase-3 subunit beta
MERPMELYIDRDELARGLARIQGVIERRSTHPILAHVLLHAKDGRLRMTATDTEIAYIGDLEANTRSNGEVAVDAAGLFQVVRSLPEATVHLASGEGNRLEVRSGRASFKLLGVPAEEYPALPPFDVLGTAVVSERDLQRVIEQVSFSVASEDVRWGLNGAHVEDRTDARGKRLRFAATDGHRLACSELPYTGDFALTPRMLVPRKALGVLRKLLEGSGGDVQLDFGEGALQLRRPGQTFWFRLLDGEFPDYKAVIPDKNKHAAVARRSDLLATLKRVGILVTDRTRPVTFRFSTEELEVRMDNVDRGEVRETLPVELEGEPIEVGFNARYLQDILSAMFGDHVRLELAHPLAPCLVRDPDDDSALFVVMPMRLD